MLFGRETLLLIVVEAVEVSVVFVTAGAIENRAALKVATLTTTSSVSDSETGRRG